MLESGKIDFVQTNVGKHGSVWHPVYELSMVTILYNHANHASCHRQQHHHGSCHQLPASAAADAAWLTDGITAATGTLGQERLCDPTFTMAIAIVPGLTRGSSLLPVATSCV